MKYPDGNWKGSAFWWGWLFFKILVSHEKSKENGEAGEELKTFETILPACGLGNPWLPNDNKHYRFLRNEKKPAGESQA